LLFCAFDDDKVKSGQALAGGPCPTGQLGDGVTCKVNPCFLKNGGQGLTLVHFSAQHKRFLWERGWILGGGRGFVGCV